MMAEGKRIASEGVEGGGGKTRRDRRARRKAIRERRSGETNPSCGREGQMRKSGEGVGVGVEALVMARNEF